MMAENSAGHDVPKTVAGGHRENSYDKPLPSAPDIQQPGKPGDFGNDDVTGHGKPQVPAAPASRKKNDAPEVTDPDEGAEPSNPYSGT